MLRINSKTTHEKFHSSTTIQSRVIEVNNFTYRNILEEINKYIGLTDKVLDVGCGAGTLCFYVANNNHMVLGIDISEKAIKTCKLTAKELSLEKKTKFEHMNFPKYIPKGKFDFIIFTEVIEHLENDKFALKQLFSLLNKKGILLLTTPSKNAPLYRLGLANKFDKRVGHLRRYSIDEIELMCEQAGFIVLSSYKKEGVLRNFLFLNPVAGYFIKVINKFKLSEFVTQLDNVSLKLFGESDIFIIAQKP